MCVFKAIVINFIMTLVMILAVIYLSSYLCQITDRYKNDRPVSKQEIQSTLNKVKFYE